MPEGHSSTITIYFDGDCTLCTTLASWAVRHGAGHVEAESWQVFYDGLSDVERKDLAVRGWDRHIPDLRAKVGDGFFEGEDAWQVVITTLPQLSQLNWLASRLGLTGVMARTTRQAGKLSRRLCRSCSRR